MANIKATLPKERYFYNREPVILSDWEISNGAFSEVASKSIKHNGSTIKKGEMFGYAWTDAAYLPVDMIGNNQVEHVAISPDLNSPDIDFHINMMEAGNRSTVLHLALQENDQTKVNKEGKLTFQGYTVYWPGAKVDGYVSVVKQIPQPFTSDKTPLNEINTPYCPIQNQSYQITANGVKGSAVKLDCVKRNNKNSVYNDGSPVIDGDTVWHWLEPMPATLENGVIFLKNGSPQQFEPQAQYVKKCNEISSYKDMRWNFTEPLRLNNFQISKITNDMLNNMEQSALVMAELLAQEKDSKNTGIGFFKRKQFTKSASNNDINKNANNSVFKN